MPYRRLPNTDKARLRAMERAFKKCLSEGQNNCVISEPVFLSLESVLPQFQHALINLEAARKNQTIKNKDYIEHFKKAKIYISHFIQVLNFAIARGELKSETRDFYGLSSYPNSLPSLNNDKNLVEWGKKLIDGEQKRILKRGNPIYNPSIALVKVNYEKFIDIYHFQKNLISTSQRASKLVNELRPEADRLILQIWNEVESSFSHLNELQKREYASDYGVSYVFRKHEKLKAIIPEKPALTEMEKITKVKTPEQEKEMKINIHSPEQESIFDFKPLNVIKKVEKKPLSEKTNKKEKSTSLQSTIDF